MSRNTIRKDGCDIAGWIFVFARIFGYWPFTNKIAVNKIDLIKMTVCDWLRLIFILGFTSIYLGFQFYIEISSFSYSTGITIVMFILMMSVQFSVFITLANIWKRHSLLKMICINQEFDDRVSTSASSE